MLLSLFAYLNHAPMQGLLYKHLCVEAYLDSNYASNRDD